MTDDAKPITRQAIAAKERSGKLTVSGKLKVAVDEMLYKAASRADAARVAGISDHFSKGSDAKIARDGLLQCGFAGASRF
jgi:hypothetical protein